MRNAPIQSTARLPAPKPSAWPPEAELAALRALHSGLSTRAAVERYAPELLADGVSARGVLGRIRRSLLAEAARRHRRDLVPVLKRAGADASLSARQLQRAIDTLSASRAPTPKITDEVAAWFDPRIARVLAASSIRTLVELTVRIPRLRGWWRSVPGLGAASARRIEAFFAANPALTEAARALVRLEQEELIPWERLRVPADLDGARGAYRAPRKSCILSAMNDYQAVNAWLALQESAATQRAYRKEAERLILWAIIERGKALSSLTTEDAIAYRAFLRSPTPRRRWVGPAGPRASPAWRPFQGALSARSVAYALSVASALYRWLIEVRYMLANPFAGVRLKVATKGGTNPAARAFSDREWALVRPLAEALDEHRWTPAAAQRLRFVLDFAFATGLRSGEFVRAQLVHVASDEQGSWWLAVIGKGNKAGRVAVPPRAKLALDRYLAARGISTSALLWKAGVPLLARLAGEGSGLTGSRLWAIVKRFFAQAADELEVSNAPLAEKLRHASPHWMRHTHASSALAAGATLTTVRDNLRHASVSTTSAYLHTDESVRAREMAAAFALKGRDNQKPSGGLPAPGLPTAR